jgi:hypothetical protein
MLQQGWDVDAADYDQRTGLMLAAGKGSSAAVKQLLQVRAAREAWLQGAAICCVRISPADCCVCVLLLLLRLVARLVRRSTCVTGRAAPHC